MSALIFKHASFIITAQIPLHCGSHHHHYPGHKHVHCELCHQGLTASKLTSTVIHHTHIEHALHYKSPAYKHCLNTKSVLYLVLYKHQYVLCTVFSKLFKHTFNELFTWHWMTSCWCGYFWYTIKKTQFLLSEQLVLWRKAVL